MTAPAGSRWRQSSVVLRPVNMNMAGPINTTSTVSAAVWTDPNAKARGRLPLLVICHACRSCLGSSLCQAVFSNKSSHVFAGISESRRAQHCKSESENQSLHHRVKIRQLQAAGIVAVARNDRMTILDPTGIAAKSAFGAIRADRGFAHCGGNRTGPPTRKPACPFGNSQKNCVIGQGSRCAFPCCSRIGFREDLTVAEQIHTIDSTGALGEIRTPDPQIRSLMLYPAELRARRPGQ
jgi:hypothetical protein